MDARAPAPSRPSAADKIRLYRTLFRGMDELKAEIKHESKVIVSWKRRALAIGGVAVLLAVGLVAAISVTQNQYYGAQGEINAYDTSTFTMLSLGDLIGVTASAAGTTDSYAGAVEISLVGGTANTALTTGHWVYETKITEAGVNTFPQSASAYYKAELFLDDTSQGALYFKNGVGDAVNAESVTLKWDLGATLPTDSTYLVKVSQVA